ncbi:alpha/beta fold hydrolase [Microbacterium saperdae]|uniref:alpha/beta fold hydrolase n=1 Tax=Microbacterium saperdae TaxID=69368 RepID=UPI0019B2CD1B|nr:alpha/beta hydrolase [Microbacterium saperdae]GGM64136.1 alpha/beta hydrolase [Microbacterium saperdae]
MPESRERPLPPTRVLPVGRREIAYCEIGDPEGAPVLAAHGSPGSRYQLMPLHEAARAAGVRIITPDRPGFGRTSVAGDRGFDTGGADAVALLDHLGIDRAAALGFSGGAGYSLASALAHPDRIDRVVLACGMVPGAPRETLEGRIPIVSTLYLVTRFAPRLAAAMLEGRGPFARTRAANVDAWPAADRAIMTDEKQQAMIAPDAAEGMRQGARAAVDDLRRYSRRIPLGEVRQPVRLVHGTADGNVPIGVARWAVSHLPDATLREIQGQGHYFAVTRPEVIIDALAIAD